MQYSTLPTLDRIVIKLASRCNINCTYCYWFRDKHVYNQPKLLLPEVEQLLFEKLERHLANYPRTSFLIVLHGGEPLLFGKKRFRKFCESIKQLEKKTNIFLPIAMATNGILLDNEWAEILKFYQVNVTLSIDGDQNIHDFYRKDFKGLGTYDKVITGLKVLRNYQIEPSVLAVCNPSSDPKHLLEEFIDKLGLKYFDVLIPEKTYADCYEPIADYYCRLFDLWYDKYADSSVKIRIFDSIIKTFWGKAPLLDNIGYGVVYVVTLQPNGKLEATDTLRIIQDAFTASNYNIFEHKITDIYTDPVWQSVYSNSQHLASECENCNLKKLCGGGPLQSRWKAENGYDNPSLYCQDFKKMLPYIKKRVFSDIYS